MASRKIIVRCSDGDHFEVDEAVVTQSETMKQMMEDDSGNKEMSLPNINSKTFFHVIQYCEKHVTTGSGNDNHDLNLWDFNFVKVLQQNDVFDLLLGARYLGIKSLIKLTGQAVVDVIKGMTPEEVRTILNIKNDFTPEEEEKLRGENKRAFE